jgi:hypothetical protein
MSGDACATDGQHQCAGDGHCHELVDLKLAVPSGVVGRPADLELSTDRVFATFVGDQAILSVPKAGGSTTVAHAAAASTGGKHAVTIATSGADLVYALFATSEIWVCPGGDCTAQTLLASGTADVYLGVLGGNVYWIDYATRTLSTCALAGCGGVPTVVGKVSNIGQGAADASGLWGAFWDGNLRHVSLADGTYSAPLAYVRNVQRLLTDGAFVYWIYDYKLSFCAEGACTQSPLAWLGGGPAVLLGVDAKQVYWLQEPNVFACPSGAPCPVPVAQYDLSAYAGLGGEGVASALDAAHLFVAGSQLLRIAR